MNDLHLDEKPELNITPLVDIMLVLLSILMVTTPAIVYREDITLPQGSKTSKAEPNNILSVRIDKEKTVFVDTKSFEYSEFLENFSLQTGEFDRNKPVYIYADKQLYYGDVMPVFAKLKNAGFTKVSLGTQ
ncbi:biopolymer transporter ExbD [Helicobacter muridarum]|uniref:Biopolymer transporter ExbD n=1 Tax=Helicobacter muridarum TaxID=216 RepID=A0A099TY68_9HELI|nr:biopolymer transporter ExbD [Helicobacter muridarum]TLD99546.1 biopolymer transporter ExbD [Helicobacter muridarum]STQ85879.1 ExbD/TolR family transport protein [Helicobacter muridarum]